MKPTVKKNCESYEPGCQLKRDQRHLSRLEIDNWKSNQST